MSAQGSYADGPKYLGRIVKDEYGRFFGIVSGYINYLPDDQKAKPSTRIIVQTSSGFVELETSRIVNEKEASIAIRTGLKYELVETRERIQWLFTRIKALEEGSGSSAEEPVFTAAHLQHKSRFNQLLSSVHPLLEAAQRRIDELKLEMETLERGLVELNISKINGLIETEAYEHWISTLRDGSNAAQMEMIDLEDEIRQLSKIEREYRDVFRVEILNDAGRS